MNFFLPIIFILLFSNQLVIAQADSSQIDSLPSPDKPKFTVGAFFDAYYLYDFDKPYGGQLAGYLYNYNRNNEININLGYLRGSLDAGRYKMTMAIMGGSYPTFVMANEPPALQLFYDAYASVALDKKRKIWLEMGILPSHISFETAISTDQMTLSRGLYVEGIPYYFSGARILYNPNPKWSFLLLACNGWQRIKRVNGSSLINWSNLIQYKPNKKINLNWANFIGTEDPDSSRRMRYFINTYAQFDWTSRWSSQVGFDIGWQQKSRGSKLYNPWQAAFIINRFRLNKRWALAHRAELFNDPNQVIFVTATPNGFSTYSSSINVDYSPFANVFFRIEGRYLHSKDAIFIKNNGFSPRDFWFLSSVALKF